MKQRIALGILIVSLFFSTSHFAHAADLALAGSNSFTGTATVAMPITDLQISGTTPATTPVKLRVTSGTLAMSTTTGLTFTGGQTGSTLYFSGTLANINAALATLTYTRAGTGTDTLEVSLVSPGEVFFTDNGHLYQYIAATTTWAQANTAAAGLSAYDSNGYLATITSQSENDFVTARLAGAGWMGASDSGVEGDWKWVTGPEAGTSFWSGVANGSTVGGNYANWGTGEPNQSGEEDCGQYLAGGTGKWNDLPCTSTTLPGYVVEFGAPGDLPTVIAKNISITTTSAPTISTITPTDNATNVGTTANLILQFSQVVTVDTGDITIRKTSDNSIIETIAVSGGQVTGTGTNTITINPNTVLEELTGYYVLIPGTAFKNGSNGYFTGIASSTTWNFTTGDFTPPTVPSVTSVKSNGAYTVGETIPVVVTFSESVTSTGNVTVTFETGTTDRTCTFTISSATSGGCTYTVQSGDTTADLSVNSVSGTISDASGNALVATTPVTDLSASKDIVIDTTFPVLTQVTQVSNPAVITTAYYHFSASETGTYTLTNCGGSTSAVVNGGIVTITGLTAGITFSCTLTLQDAAGNISNQLTIGPFSYISPGIAVVAVQTPIVIAGASGSGFSVSAPKVTTSGKTVTVNLKADSNTVKYYALSTNPTFADTVLVPYSDTATITLPSTGPQTIYLKYVSTTGHSSEVFSQVVGSGSVNNTKFTRTLRTGMTGQDVRMLQKFLNENGYTVTAAGPGSLGNETETFGPATRAALVRFQESKSDTVLAPLGLKKGTGVLALQTIKAIESTLII